MKLYEVFNAQSKVILNTEYCGTLSLENYLTAGQINTNKEGIQRELKRKFIELVKAVSYAHLMKISHRDIKLDNILINEEGSLKLIDFGFAVYRKNDKQLVNNYCGTPTYMAPEIIKRIPYDPCKADTWALGIILYRLVVGEYPFCGKDDNELFEKIISGDYKCYDYMEDSLKELLNNIFEPSPSKRINTFNILESKWFNDS